MSQKAPRIFTKGFSSSRVKPLLLITAHYSFISGGYRRVYEVIKNGKLEGIDYVIVTDQTSYENYVKMFPDLKDIFQEYKLYIVSSQTPRNPVNLLSFVCSVSRIGLQENVDVIVGSSEGSQNVWTSFLSGKICKKPWTFIFHGQRDIFQPTPKLGSLNLFNALNHVSQKPSQKTNNLRSKIGSSLGLLTFLKLAEKSLVLTVSPSVAEEIGFLNPRINFRVIVPGNGINLKKFDGLTASPLYDAVFFSRLLPEKGLFDIPEITKLLVQRIPTVRIAVAGVSENPKFVEAFHKKIRQYNLADNIVFLGQQDYDSILKIVKSSKLTIYPSTSDTYGLAVLESLACGRPVVAYDIPAIRHNFGKGKYVFRCPVKDRKAMAKEILFLLENEDFRISLSEKAKKYASAFDWRNVVRAEKEAYLQVIKWFSSGHSIPYIS